MWPGYSARAFTVVVPIELSQVDRKVPPCGDCLGSFVCQEIRSQYTSVPMNGTDRTLVPGFDTSVHCPHEEGTRTGHHG